MVLSMPISRPTKPSVLTGQSNGSVNPALLLPVESTRTALVWQMVGIVARSMRAFHAAAAKEGLVLTSTGRGRTYAQQESLFRSRYTTTYLEGRPYKVWNGVKWYQKPGTAMAAVPGTSNHGWWISDDMAKLLNGAVIAFNSADLQILYRLGPTFGFMWESTSENWHVTWTNGDNLTAATLAFEAGDKPDKPARPVVGVGYVGPLATCVQLILNEKSGAGLTVDGWYGARTATAWNNLVMYLSGGNPTTYPADGEVSGLDWDLLAYLNGGWDRLYYCGFPREAT